jgi:hypothetical protein
MAGARVVTALKALDFAKNLSGRQLVREGGWVASGQIVAVAARIAGLRLITELVSPQVFGEVVLLLGLAALGTNMFCLSVLMAMGRYFPDAARGRRVGALRLLLRDLLVPRTLAVAGLLAIGGVPACVLALVRDRFRGAAGVGGCDDPRVRRQQREPVARSCARDRRHELRVLANARARGAGRRRRLAGMGDGDADRDAALCRSDDAAGVARLDHLAQ